MILTLFSILFFFIFLQIFFKLYGDRLERTVETKYESTEVTLESQGGWWGKIFLAREKERVVNRVRAA